jgi:maleate isomerase
MDGESDRCALELSDAQVDVLGYACLVAIMSMGLGYHRVSQERLEGRTRENNAPTPVVGGPTVWRKPAKVRELALSLSE